MSSIKSIYFLGIGGIGMSAIARYYLKQSYKVAGYDKTPSPITDALIAEGADIHFEDNVANIPQYAKDADNTLVIYTPAIPNNHTEFNYFKDNNYTVIKRAKALGLITESSDALCVAGTHGKTTTSSMLAHILAQSTVECNAFLGGILKNYNSNLILSNKSNFTVIEADEYDRSFHNLTPYMAVITSSDPDHLDIYKTPEAYYESFEHFTSLIKSGGKLLIKEGLNITPRTQSGVETLTYGIDRGDYHAEDIRVGNGAICFNLVTPNGTIADIDLGVPVRINIENSIAAMAIAQLNGVSDNEIRAAISSYRGAERRFDFWIKGGKPVLLDDYAHHPDEVNASITSVKELYPNRHLTVVFYPHLYSRTNDFAPQFAESLSKADRVILLPIYPAREEPMEGVTSQIILDSITPDTESEICPNSQLIERIKGGEFDILMTMGAGDIDQYLPAIKEILEKR